MWIGVWIFIIGYLGGGTAYFGILRGYILFNFFFIFFLNNFLTFFHFFIIFFLFCGGTLLIFVQHSLIHSHNFFVYCWEV